MATIEALCTSDPSYMALAENVRHLRMQLGWTQGELAEAVGTSIPQISHLETGKANPTLQSICKIAEALGTTAAELVRENTLTISEAAGRLGVSRQRMHVLVRTYNLKTEKVGMMRRVEMKELKKIPSERPTGRKVAKQAG